MKPLWKSIIREKCRYRPIDEDERSQLSHYSHLQRYFPALEHFHKERINEPLSQLELPSHYTVQQWVSSDSTDPRKRCWEILRTSVDGEVTPCRAFMKVVHLIHPIDRIREKYTSVAHPLLPSSSTWMKTVDKIHRPYNQAYVDNVANFILSRVREKNLLPHGVFYYGSYTGISSSYSYNLTGEYETYRNHSWFWRALKDYHSRITLVYRDSSMKDQTYFKQLYQDLTQPPSHFLEECSESSSSSRSPCSSLSSSPRSTSSLSDKKEEDRIDPSDLTELVELEDLVVMERINNSADADADFNLQVVEDLDIPEMDSVVEAFERKEDTDDESVSQSDESDSSYLSWADSFDITLQVPDVPVSIIVQEKQEGVMDELLEKEEVDGHSVGSAEWEKRWVAWLFQVTAILTFLQHALSFVHNDLHTNNIVWRKTEQPYLYYRLKGKTVWRVPTYGKIFSLIDFGRSTFRIGKQYWISDDFLPNEDAAGQYNFDAFLDPKEPVVEPNPSFDLCRLAVSLLSGLFEEAPPKKKGKQVKTLSQEGSWIVYETTSPLYNLLWKWTLDDNGKTVYENRHGEERYEGFDLYIHIAKHVHSAVPLEQLHMPIFQGFVWKQPVPDQETVYCLNSC
jgi:hypothetical protein